MRAVVGIAVSVALGATSLACGLLTNVDWDRVVVHDGGAGTSGASGGTSGTSSGASGTSGTSGETGSCSADQVECLAADGSSTIGCCASAGDPGNPIAIAAGGANTCGLSANGQIKCWGANGSGQLGRGTGTSDATSPLRVFRIVTGASAVSVGGSHVCAIVGGFVSCWGANTSGQLGDGDTNGTSLPAIIQITPRPSSVDSISAGMTTTCASFGHQGFCWGDNTALQAGSDADPMRVITPKAVAQLASLDATDAAIVAGNHHSCASAGSGLFCWGTNSSNELGSAGASQSAHPLAVVNGAGPARLAVGDTHTCALVNGAVACWGSNIFGELGKDTSELPSSGAVTPVGLGSGVGSVCTGDRHTCVVQGGTVLCFGSNDSGQLGIATQAAVVPTQVSGLSGFTAKQVACGTMHTCALSEQGAIMCWGYGLNGERGDGTTDMVSKTPRDVQW